MKIEAKKYFIEMTHNELWEVAWNIKRELESTLKTHWINYQLNWKEYEKSRLEILKDMFYALGRPELFDNIESEAQAIFEKHEKSKKDNSNEN